MQPLSNTGWLKLFLTVTIVEIYLGPRLYPGNRLSSRWWSVSVDTSSPYGWGPGGFHSQAARYIVTGDRCCHVTVPEEAGRKMFSIAQHLIVSVFLAIINNAVMNILMSQLISGSVIIFLGHIPGSEVAGSKETHFLRLLK